MECYICHRLIKRGEYTRHVGSHLAGNDTGPGMYDPLQDPSLAPFSYDTVDYHHHGTAFPAHSTPPRLRARIPLERNHPPRPATPDVEPWSSDSEDLSILLPADDNRRAYVISSHSPARTALKPDSLQPETLEEPPNPFQLWLQNPVYDSPGYTTIDGQKSKPDLQVQFRQDAGVLRGTTREEIIKIVNEFQGFSDRDKKTCLEFVQNVPIFPGLIAYTYTHLILCPRRGWLFSDNWSDRVSELKQLVERWTKSGDIQCILECSSIKNRLLQILGTTEVKEHKCNPRLLNGTMVLDYDILNLASMVALCITGPQKEDILDQRDARAEGLVELFHNLLEANINLEKEYRRHFLNPLIQFSKDFGYSPRGIQFNKSEISGLVSENQGGFGFVYRGRVRSRLVAVKALKRGNLDLLEYNKQVSKEAIIWRHLRHPNCLPLYGVYRMPAEGPDINTALVSPWMDRGTLFKYLERNPEANLTQLILDVVRGLDYLHSMQPHVAHRDIKPDNILITNQERACLADFGLVSTFDADDRFHTAPSQIVMGGTCNYMAPEILEAENKEDRRKVNKRACDMYALGCTIYAAYTGKHPFHEMGPREVWSNVVSDRRPEYPGGNMPLDMWSFTENLWDPHPSKRLTAQKALGWMETKAHQEGVDPNITSFEEEWEWRGPHDNEGLWAVSF